MTLWQILRDQRGLLGGWGHRVGLGQPAPDRRGLLGCPRSRPAPPPPPPPPPPDNAAAQEAAARARRALQRKRGRQQTILAGASAPLGLTTNPGGTTLGEEPTMR